MVADDMPSIARLSDAVHGAYSERPEVYAERLALYPAGCMTLDWRGEVGGYLIGHPWRAGAPPKLDALIGALPAEASLYYLHDLAILPERRGGGLGVAACALAVGQAVAAGFDEVRLVAVNGADSFWRRLGFVDAPAGEAPAPYGAGSRFMRRTL